ncbi:MAG: hypothetical protein V7774_07930 [Pseudorhizobium pelagicum]|uniref:hypothetical protein n=1 Tax=Pseudorhizobium pelagicum TaxID=1509405 RepID=UPI0034608F61
MDNISDIQMCEPAPFLFGENGHFGVTDGVSVWTVVVTNEAMLATADPPAASLKRLRRYSALYRDVAEGMLTQGQDRDGKVWIFEKDIIARRPTSFGRPWRFPEPSPRRSV